MTEGVSLRCRLTKAETSRILFKRPVQPTSHITSYRHTYNKRQVLDNYSIIYMLAEDCAGKQGHATQAGGILSTLQILYSQKQNVLNKISFF
jgi:hypothetical protein